MRGGAARSSPLSLPRKQPNEPGWGGAGLALMTSRVRLKGCESSSAKPLLGSFQERSFNPLPFPGHCADLNVNTLSRIQAPPASSEARNDAGSRPDPHSTGTGPWRVPKALPSTPEEAFASPQEPGCRFPGKTGAVCTKYAVQSATPTENKGQGRNGCSGNSQEQHLGNILGDLRKLKPGTQIPVLCPQQ